MCARLLNRLLIGLREKTIWIALVTLETAITKRTGANKAVESVGIWALDMLDRTGGQENRAGLIGVSIKPVGLSGDGVKPAVIEMMDVADERFFSFPIILLFCMHAFLFASVSGKLF